MIYAVIDACWHALRGAVCFSLVTGGIASLNRPAICCHASGMKKPSLKKEVVASFNEQGLSPA
jgi:hypothetical protein